MVPHKYFRPKNARGMNPFTHLSFIPVAPICQGQQTGLEYHERLGTYQAQSMCLYPFFKA